MENKEENISTIQGVLGQHDYHKRSIFNSPFDVSMTKRIFYQTTQKKINGSTAAQDLKANKKKIAKRIIKIPIENKTVFKKLDTIGI